MFCLFGSITISLLVWRQATAEAVCERIGIFDDFGDRDGKSYTASEFVSLSPMQQTMALQKIVLLSRYLNK
jgi:hypothetical protein